MKNLQRNQSFLKQIYTVPHSIIAEDVKRWFLLQLCQVRDINSYIVEEMPWPKTGAFHYELQLGSSINELVVCVTFDHIRSHVHL